MLFSVGVCVGGGPVDLFTPSMYLFTPSLLIFTGCSEHGCGRVIPARGAARRREAGQAAVVHR